ncbi:MAG TPA: alpha/beta hydrolase [Euzebyales bacterium]
MTDGAERFEVPVEGGGLAVWRWGGDGPVAIAAHGITSSHTAWDVVGELVADDLTLVVPDLRGRGDSADVSGSSSMRRHASDLLAVLDHIDVDEAVVTGHSMGAMVAAALAAASPDRARAVVMVDGGPPLAGPVPPDVDVDAVLSRAIGPALERLQQRFDSRDEYRRFWREHPAFRDSRVDPARIDAYADHDLRGQPGDLRSKVSADRVREDGRDSLTNADLHDVVSALEMPAVLLVAERGMLNGATPLITDEQAAELQTARGPLEVIRVPDTNHYTIMLDDRGARAVAHQLRRFATADLGDA